MLKKSTSWAVLIYGILLMGLGYLGYHNSGSVISLWAGGGTGALLVISSVLMFIENIIGSYVAVILTFLLTATFGIRYSMTHKSVPAILAVLSGGMLLFLLAKTAKWKK
ncbi:MAG: hypothetical protein COT85_02330 [Chlamydiae bacterium CG10_big_fil_rev_8_21_14_0_10_42_34]|nr:MAG: hypothetical protein COT85_02330 [Chlamydiae bacterium CG10_big_fil_rev_8_21_14_0_10_42_34]